jgi:6-phosphogluconolactonase
MRQIIFITLAADDRVSCWEINETNGRLNNLSQTSISGRPAPLAIDYENRLLYVGRRDLPIVSSYDFDTLDGSLKHHSDSPIMKGDPCYISLDNRNQYLFGAYYNAGAVSVQEVKKGEFVGEVDWIPTGPGAHCAMTDSANRFLMLPHIAGEQGLNTIKLFKFDQHKGKLLPNDPQEVRQPDNRGPRHYVFHPNGRFAYYSNEQDSSVTSYSYDSQSGNMVELQTESTLPMHYGGVNTCAQLRVTPNGRYLFAPNRGHNSIAGFTINSETGSIIQNGRTSTEPVPRVLDVDFTGQYLYSAGLESGFVSAFKINEDGSLDLIDRYEVGNEPMWMLTVQIE